MYRKRKALGRIEFITMKNPQFLLLLLPLISLLFLQQTSAIGSPSPSTSPATYPADFIRTSCAATTYPEVCYYSLSPFTNFVHSNPTRLSMAAIAVSLKNAKRTATSLAILSKNSNANVAGALDDCSSNFDDAIDEITDSFDQMKTLGSGTGSVRFQLSNVQTWMSAALTNAETCTDGIQDMEDGPIKKEVVYRAEMVKKMASNALAMVNGLANRKGTQP